MTHQANKGRGQHHSLDAASEPGGGRQSDQTACRMCKQKEGKARIRQDDCVQESREIALVVRKPADMAAQRILQQPLRSTLTAQIEGCKPKDPWP